MFARGTTRLTASPLAAVALAALSLAGTGARADDGDPPAPVEQVAEREPALAHEPVRDLPAPPNSGVLEGRVLWSEPLPEMSPLSRNAEPYCARLGTQLDGSLQVSAGGLEGALVRLRATHASAPLKSAAPLKPPASLDPPASAPTLLLSLTSCAFAPRVLGLVAGQHLVIESADPILHAVRLTRERSVVYRRTLDRDQPAPELRFAEAGVYRIGCDVHPWEVAWVVVAPPEDAPAFAVTDAQGHFRIEGVPAGSYQIDAWHERATVTGPAVRVRAGTIGHATLHAQPTTALAHEEHASHPAP